MARVSGSGFSFFIPGTAVVATNQAAVLIPAAFTISHVKIYSETSPTVQNLIVDVNINGTSIFATTQENRPQVTPTNKAANSGIPNTTALAAGDRLSVDVDQVGTVAGGAPLLVTVVLV